MAFRLYAGKVKRIWFPRPGSQVFAQGDVVYPNGSGQVIPADATAGRLVGVMAGTVLATDADYATADILVPIDIPMERWVEWRVIAASAVADDILNEIDLTDATTVDRANSAKDAVLVTRFLSATELVVILLSTADNLYTATT